MAEQKKKRELKVSPPGKAVYPWVNKPDTKFDKGGVYHVKLVFSSDDEAGYAWAESMVEQIDKAQAQALKEAKASFQPTKKNKKFKEKLASLPYEVDEDEGTITLAFKKKATFEKDGEVVKTTLPLFDAKGGKIDRAKTLIGSDSILRVSYDLDPFCNTGIGAGVSLRLFAVKVIDLVAYEGGGSAEGFGFDEEEDGYDASEDSDDEDTEVEPDDDEDTETDDSEDDDEDTETETEAESEDEDEEPVKPAKKTGKAAKPSKPAKVEKPAKPAAKPTKPAKEEKPSKPAGKPGKAKKASDADEGDF